MVYDLFAGAGLFSYAFLAEGFRVKLAVEIDRTAIETYVAQIGDHVIAADVRSVEPDGSCQVLIAGPPCQPFSTLGRRCLLDERRRLSMEVVRWTRALRPRIVVVENVAAFAEAPEHSRLVEAFRRSGYETGTVILEALDFGVPQYRLRSFTFASLGRLPFPQQRKTIAPRTVKDAFRGLPSAPDDRNNHFAPVPGPLALARMQLIPEGGDKRDVMRQDSELVPPSWRAMGVEVTDAWGRLSWDEPANTLRTCFNNASKGRYLHPEQNRVISLREAARLHSIPDSFSFSGWPSDVARQIGNSVPPLMGRAVARAVLKAL